jgi:uncharacterized protein YjiS (DUF1127 family)
MAHSQCLGRTAPLHKGRAMPLAFSPRRRLFDELGALIKEWRRREHGRRELAALSDRCLRDIGLTRYDVRTEVRKPFWRA